MSAPLLSVGLNTFGDAPGGDWRGVLDAARAVEDAGAGRIVVPDHVVNGPRVADYPWGRFPTGPDGDWLEPLTVLAAVSAVTTSVRLGTGVLVAPARPAVVLAKTAATLDVLSGGRLDLGVGTGWQDEELAAAGVDPARRGQVLTDTIGACRALWSGGPTTFSSPTLELRDVWCAPRPAQARLPVWCSGTLHARNVDRIVGPGDGWIPIMGTTPEQLRDGVEVLAAACRRAGRDPAEVRVRAAATVVRGGAGGAVDVGATAAAFRPWLAAGATDVQVNARALVDDPWDPGSLGPAVAATVAALAQA